jgi:hypothetical protein
MAEHTREAPDPLWGVAAEFATAEAMVAAARVLRPMDLGRLDAYTPVPIAELAEAMSLRRRHLYPYALAGALAGALLMFGLCAYGSVVAYPFRIGGRPLFSWPSFVVPSISFGAATGAVVILLLMLTLNRLPRLNHPAFNILDFVRASSDRFFLAVEARDHNFDADAAERALLGLAAAPVRVSRVPR